MEIIPKEQAIGLQKIQCLFCNLIMSIILQIRSWSMIDLICISNGHLKSFQMRDLGTSEMNCFPFRRVFYEYTFDCTMQEDFNLAWISGHMHEYGAYQYIDWISQGQSQRIYSVDNHFGILFGRTN